MNHRELNPTRAVTLGIIAFAMAGVVGVALNADDAPRASGDAAVASESKAAEEHPRPQASTRDELVVDDDGSSEPDASADEPAVDSDEAAEGGKGGDADVAAQDFDTSANGGGLDAGGPQGDGEAKYRPRPPKGEDG